MNLSRRTLLKGASALTLAAGTFGPSALAQTAPTAPIVAAVCVIFLLASNTLAKKFDEPGIM